MFELCLFDLDNTLIRTDDLDRYRVKGKSKEDFVYEISLLMSLKAVGNRCIYSENIIKDIIRTFPNMKLGVFTKSPNLYANYILNNYYPSIKWDIIIANEDVSKTKPSGEGIITSMQSCGITDNQKVVLVGDTHDDIRAAYNAGCVIILDTTSWEKINWYAHNLIPDAIIDNPNSLIKVLSNYHLELPELERRLANNNVPHTSHRFVKVGKFPLQKNDGPSNKPYQVHALGRLFSNYDSLSNRLSWHNLTQSIHSSKATKEFPAEWYSAIQTFLETFFPNLNLAKNPLIITTIPARPGRMPRLNYLLDGLKEHLKKSNYANFDKLDFEADVLAYKEGVKSNSGDKLNSEERFDNIQKHLYVKRPELFENAKKRVVIIDDVCTSGASLITAGNLLLEAGSGNITRLAISMTISDVL